MENNTKKLWKTYYKTELTKIIPLLDNLGFSLEEEQVHVIGERYIINNQKLILTGRRVKNGQRVIIKISNNEKFIKEIEHERKCREILKKIDFSSHVFFSPQEILFTKKQGFIIFVTAFIEQENTFLERPFEEQFFLALKALEVQEGVHATTYKHASVIKKIFGIWNAEKYFEIFNKYKKEIESKSPENKKTKIIFLKAQEFIRTNFETINLYSGFLVHWDFVPHNIRIDKLNIYLLDHSSMRFGNKHESWARFINFMTLYNPKLEKALIDYIKDNRSQEETLSLQLMRVFRLTELIKYYVSTLENLSGNVLTLNKKRIEFWSNALEAVLDNKFVRQEIIDDYKNIRDSLRSEDEKQRQKNLH